MKTIISSEIENRILDNIIVLMKDFRNKTNDEEEVITLTSAFLYVHKAVNSKWIPSKDIDLILEDLIEEILN